MDCPQNNSQSLNKDYEVLRGLALLISPTLPHLYFSLQHPILLSCCWTTELFTFLMLVPLSGRLLSPHFLPLSHYLLMVLHDAGPETSSRMLSPKPWSVTHVFPSLWYTPTPMGPHSTLLFFRLCSWHTDYNCLLIYLSSPTSLWAL